MTLRKAEPTVLQMFEVDMGPKDKGKKNLSFWIPTKKKNKINVATKSKLSQNTVTFQKTLEVTLFIGQLFSLIPVKSISSSNVLDVRFIRFSWKCVYSVLSLIGQLYMTIMCVVQVMNSEASLNGTTPLIFYATTFITMVMFIQTAKKWPGLVVHIAKTEDLDPNFDTRLPRKMNITCAVVLSLALLEHILSVISGISGAMECLPNLSFYEAFARHFYPWVFNYLNYALPLAILTQLMHVQSTFIWNYSDLFVISISYYLTSRLEQINKKLLEAQGKYLPEAFWRSSREDYCRITQLVKRVDDVISGIIFISFANNLFYICLQLFNTLEDGIKGTGGCKSKSASPKSHILGGYETAAYFVFSLVFLISRSVAVSLIASQVNSASTVPTSVLYDVPSPVYCVEVQRFIDQVNGEKVALSGLQFFNVTRGLLLTVAGTIVTYELVMFQFNSSNPTSVNATTAPMTTLAPNVT